MPLPQKAPKLSETEINEAKREFIEDVRRDLLIRGEDPLNPHVASVLAEMPDQITVTSRISGPEVWWSARLFGRRKAVGAAAAVAELAAERELLASYGPDPVKLLTERLMKLGLSQDEAITRAAGRVQRLEDGRVTAFKADGAELYNSPPLDSNREYTDEQLAAIRNPRPALELATRAILAERSSQPPPRPKPEVLRGEKAVLHQKLARALERRGLTSEAADELAGQGVYQSLSDGQAFVNFGELRAADNPEHIEQLAASLALQPTANAEREAQFRRELSSSF